MTNPALATSADDAIQSNARRIAFRTAGHAHGPITRLMSPGDVGELVKPFVFLDYFETEMVEAEIVIPYSQQQRVAAIYENARVVRESFDDDGRRMTIKALPAAIGKLTGA